MYGLIFDSGKKVLTRKGQKYVFNATPTEEFWEAWRSDKGSVKNKGFSVSKKGDGYDSAWFVNRWEDVPDHVKKLDKEFNRLSKQEELTTEDVLLKPDNLNYLGYQKVGITYALQKKSCLIGDEMGLGKTIQAIGVMNNISDFKTAIIICPASLKVNWYREIKKWLINQDLTIEIITSKSLDQSFDKNISEVCI